MTEITKLNFENDEMNHSWHCLLTLDQCCMIDAYLVESFYSIMLYHASN